MWGILNFVSILGFVHFGEKTSRFENVCKQLKKYLQKKQHLQVHLKNLNMVNMFCNLFKKVKLSNILDSLHVK